MKLLIAVQYLVGRDPAGKKRYRLWRAARRITVNYGGKRLRAFHCTHGPYAERNRPDPRRWCRRAPVRKRCANSCSLATQDEREFLVPLLVGESASGSAGRGHARCARSRV